MNLYLNTVLFIPEPLDLLFFPKHFQYTSLPIILSYAFLLNYTFNELLKRSKNINSHAGSKAADEQLKNQAPQAASSTVFD